MFVLWLVYVFSLMELFTRMAVTQAYEDGFEDGLAASRAEHSRSSFNA